MHCPDLPSVKNLSSQRLGMLYADRLQLKALLLFPQLPGTFYPKATPLPTKPTSNNQLNKNKKNGNLSSFRIKLKDLFAPDLPLRSVKTVAGYTSQLTSPPVSLLLPFSPFHVPQVLFARILYVLNNNSPHGKLHLATCFP